MNTSKIVARCALGATLLIGFGCLSFHLNSKESVKSIGSRNISNLLQIGNLVGAYVEEFGRIPDSIDSLKTWGARPPREIKESDQLWNFVSPVTNESRFWVIASSATGQFVIRSPEKVLYKGESPQLKWMVFTRNTGIAEFTDSQLQAFMGL